MLLLYQELHGTTSIQQDLSVSSLRHMAAGHPQTQRRCSQHCCDTGENMRHKPHRITLEMRRSPLHFHQHHLCHQHLHPNGTLYITHPFPLALVNLLRGRTLSTTGRDTHLCRECETMLIGSTLPLPCLHLLPLCSSGSSSSSPASSCAPVCLETAAALPCKAP